MASVQAKAACQQCRSRSNPLRLPGYRQGTEQDAVGPVGPACHHIHAVVNAIAHIHVKPPRLTKERFVAGGAATVAVTGGVVLGIRLRFHNRAPQEAAIGLAFHQKATDEVGGNQLGRAGEEGVREGLGKGGGYGSGLGGKWRLLERIG